MSATTMGEGMLPELEEELEGEEFDLGSIVSGLLGEGEFEDEDEYELEGEWEGEFEDEGEALANPLRRVYPDAMMEHLGHAAAEAETEAEAEAFVGALVPLAAGLVRKAAPYVARSTPHLVRGLSTVAHTLRRNPTTRQLVRVLPTVASRTTRALARDVAHGRPITPRRAVRTLASQTAAVLSSPQARRNIVRRARALDNRYHRATRSGQWWTGAAPGASGAAVQALGPRPTRRAARAPREYRYGAPVQYRYGAPVQYRYGAPTGYRYGTPTEYRYGTPVRYGPGAPIVPGAARRRTGGRPAARRGQPSRGALPPGLSIAWVPVPAWHGSRPPSRSYRY